MSNSSLRKLLEYESEDDVDSQDLFEPFPVRPSSPDNITLTLLPLVAQQLISMFGPVGVHMSSDTLTMSDLRVELDHSTAQKLHQCLAASMEMRFHSEESAIQRIMDIKEDEEFARRLQAEEEKSSPSRRGPSSFHPVKDLAASPSKPAPESLQEIMDTEMAIERSKKDYDSTRACARLDGDLSTKIKRQLLYEKFPTIDKTLLNEAFTCNDLSLENTVAAVSATMGRTSPIRTVMTEDLQQRLEEKMIAQAKAESLKQQALESGSAAEEADSDGYQAIKDPDYADYRAEASLHYRLRQECFAKAQKAHCRGHKSVAVFYSQQGSLHTEKLKAANMRAAEMIVEQRNTLSGADPYSLDLHGLHVDEAIHTLRNFIANKQSERRADVRYISVVTGRGKHSLGGVAKIKPAVLNFLRDNKFRYSEPQPGLIKVDIR